MVPQNRVLVGNGRSGEARSMPFDPHEAALQLTVGLVALVAVVVTSVLGLVRRQPGWLYVAAVCMLGPSYYLLGLSDVVAAVGALGPLLLAGAGFAVRCGRRDVASVAVVPVYFGVFLLLLMYGMAAAG